MTDEDDTFDTLKYKTFFVDNHKVKVSGFGKDMTFIVEDANGNSLKIEDVPSSVLFRVAEELINGPR